MWGSFGKGNGRFDGQNDVDALKGHVYVADTGNHRIQVFKPLDSSTLAA